MVESTGSTDRAKLKAEIMTQAKHHIKAYNVYEVVNTCEKTVKVDGEDKTFKTETRRHWEEGKGYVIVTKGDIGGLTIKKWKEFRDKIAENTAKMQPDKASATKLENADGADMAVLMHAKFPWPMSNRVFIQAFYWDDSETEKGIYQ